MSAQPKFKEDNQSNQEVDLREKKVNLNDLVNRMNLEKKKEKKNTYILSAAAISAVTVFGIILTL
tara:strand:+ start:127 stop:321 length:195 start_codon:yes stop_codon:yes gene_type:complete